MDKRTMILDAMATLVREGKGNTASVSDIAKTACIAKGGMYYYFRSKEEVLDALVARQYDSILPLFRQMAQRGENALQKLRHLIGVYHQQVADPDLDHYLHLPQNAAIHQKSLTHILNSIALPLADILRQGVEEGVFHCEDCLSVAQIFLSAFVFLFDPGLFDRPEDTALQQLQALSLIMERSLMAPPDSFRFFWDEKEWERGTSGL